MLLLNNSRNATRRSLKFSYVYLINWKYAEKAGGFVEALHPIATHQKTPNTVDEALAELESHVGKEGRRKFEKFLGEVAEDEDKGAIDV